MTNQVLIFPDAEDFLKVMEELQEAYNKKVEDEFE